MYEIQRSMLSASSAMASLGADMLSDPKYPFTQFKPYQMMASTLEVFAHAAAPRGKPAFGLRTVEVDGHHHVVHESTVITRPFGDLKRFSHDGLPDDAPRLLIVAPMSGHYATLLRGTVEAFAPDHAVFITDWSNARDVPMMEGRFEFDDYIDHIQKMLEALGHRAHVVAVCQPGPPVLAAAALMAQDENPYRPRSMTFMGSPIDARLSPTVTNKLAEERPFTWFQSSMIYTVPPPYPGAGRRVYPGFVQLASFMSMNLDRHKDAHRRYFDNLVAGDGDGADKHLAFYDEYLAVMDLTEEFYLQTIDKVFQSYALPKGELEHRGRLVEPAAITDIALMTVEGELDDISGIGQTQAAHDLCPNIPASMKLDHVQEGVGHYGVFNGRRFKEEIFPKVQAFIREMDPDF
jgi:poly(3-hydroxybutyrate) depolymerase